MVSVLYFDNFDNIYIYVRSQIGFRCIAQGSLALILQNISVCYLHHSALGCKWFSGYTSTTFSNTISFSASVSQRTEYVTVSCWLLFDQIVPHLPSLDIIWSRQPPPAVRVTKIASSGPVIVNPLSMKTHFDCNLHLKDNCVFFLPPPVALFCFPCLCVFLFFFLQRTRFEVLPEMLPATFSTEWGCFICV